MVIIPTPIPRTVGQPVPEFGSDGWLVGEAVAPEQIQFVLVAQDGLRQKP